MAIVWIFALPIAIAASSLSATTHLLSSPFTCHASEDANDIGHVPNESAAAARRVDAAAIYFRKHDDENRTDDDVSASIAARTTITAHAHFGARYFRIPTTPTSCS